MMKRSTIIFVSILLIILIALSAATFFVATGIFDKYHVEEPNISIDSSSKNIYIEFPILHGNIELYADLTGIITYEDGIKDVSVDVANIVEITCHVGDDVVGGETVLYTTNTGSYIAPVSGKILAIGQDTITMFDYDASHILLRVPSEYQTLINYHNPIDATFNEVKTELSIISISPRISDGTFEIVLNNPFNAFDGSEVNIHISFETKENVVLVNSFCLHEDSDGSLFLNILDEDGNISKCYVQIGVENGNVVELKNASELVGKTAVLSKEEMLLKGES